MFVIIFSYLSFFVDFFPCDCSPVYFFLYFYFHFSFLSPCIFPFFVVSFLSLVLFLLFVVFCNFLPYLCKIKILCRLLRSFVISSLSLFYVFFFHVLLCPSFRLWFVPFSCFLAVFLHYFQFILILCFFLCVFCYVLLSTFNLFPFLVLFSYMSLFLSFVSPCVHQFLTSPMSLTADVSTGQLLPVASFVEYPQQVDLEHLRMDHNIWPFQAESGRHARLVSISDNTV